MIKTNTELIIAKYRGKKFESDSQDTVRIQNLFYYSCLEFGFQFNYALNSRTIVTLMQFFDPTGSLAFTLLVRSTL